MYFLIILSEHHSLVSAVPGLISEKYKTVNTRVESLIVPTKKHVAHSLLPKVSLFIDRVAHEKLRNQIFRDGKEENTMRSAPKQEGNTRS